MRNAVRDLIETELAEAIVSGLAEAEALAEAAGLLKKAERVYSRLSSEERPPRRTGRKRRKR
jgi:hypothetical protein